jgi:hypothetical protein
LGSGGNRPENQMKTMSLVKFGLGHVDSVETEKPIPGPSEVLVKVLACGVCRTDLHLVGGELPKRAIPVVRDKACARCVHRIVDCARRSAHWHSGRIAAGRHERRGRRSPR